MNPVAGRSFTPLAIASLIAILLITSLCYLPGLTGGFTFDDHSNIVRNEAVQIESAAPEALSAAALSYGEGIYRRPLSMLSVALNYATTGLEPLAYKVTNLGIHLVNGVLVFFLVRALLRTPLATSQLRDHDRQAHWFALLVCAAWLLHPLNLTSVLYVIQRMASLAALFCLAGMLLYTQGRLRVNRGAPGGATMIVAAAFIATPLAFWSKENGVLLPAYLLLIEWLFFGFATPRTASRYLLAALFALLVGAPALYAVVRFITNPEWITGGYVNRPFDLEERLLTQPRVLWLYLRLLAVPRLSELSLFHDDLVLSTAWTRPWTTLPAFIGIVSMAAAAVLLHRRFPILAFGVLLFLGGHTLESSVFPLEIVHEHRNYLPGLGILLIITWAVFGCWRTPQFRRLGAGVMVALIALFATLTALRAEVWSHPYKLAFAGVIDHPQSARWHHELGWALWVGREAAADPEQRESIHARARRHFLRAAELSPYNAPGDLLTVLHVDSTAGRPTDEVVMSRLIQELPEGPVAPFTVGAMHALLSCLPTELCVHAVRHIDLLVDALAANPTLGSKRRGLLFAAAGRAAAKAGDADRALSHLQAAVDADPSNLQHSLNYAAVLIATGQTTQAAEVLERVRGPDIPDRIAEAAIRLQARLHERAR